ncbi:sodium:proton antiporter [Ornithinimicrobium pekingense]|uniref:Cation:proton antiporter n=1 Tax=Ornithinimicrobium pekingense TaxID=384677 RepID=A0ABQ2F366_9MICO|nr:cation:proton antiporter subunit C [Ornithinimicrobium pekingense]GGK57562.1 cation:proton antiporter [Ornithinimicrobium pekingense]
MIIAASVAVLVTGGVYLLLQRSMVRVIFGLALLSHAANLILLLAGVSAWRGEPLPDRVDPAVATDPLPHAFVLTAIVIAFAVTVLMLGMAVIGHNDDTKRMPATGEERAT